MKLTTEALEDISDNVSDFEDAATARWLSAKLEPARKAARDVPSAEAVARMRTPHLRRGCAGEEGHPHRRLSRRAVPHHDTAGARVRWMRASLCPARRPRAILVTRYRFSMD